MASSVNVPVVNEISEDGMVKGAETSFNGKNPMTPDKQRTRFGVFDPDSFFELQAATSPSQAKRALESHLKETDRRLEEASRIGTSLVQQRQELAERLKEVEKQGSGSEIGPELKQKLIDIEKEYNDLSRDSARAFLAPKARLVSTEDSSNGSTTVDPIRSASPTKFSSQATDSPSKVNVPQRKSRNQANKVHDIEFATEISSSLLSQVRQLQGALAEKDESLRATTLEKAQLEANAQNYTQRLRNMDENEQRYKDENWSLETQTHELIAAAKDAASREQKLQQSLAVASAEKASAQRELDDIKSAHAKLNEEHSAFRKVHDVEVTGLRKSVTLADSDRGSLQKKIDELTSQNHELAQAMATRMKAGEGATAGEIGSEPDDFSLDKSESEHSPPPSPSKGPTRNSMLEQETMRSSLGHAHRMIQKLKNDVHREKSEKLELKRLLQDSKDQLDERRADANGKKSKSKAQHDSLRKGQRSGQLGGVRTGRTDIELEDPDWEEHDEQATPKHAAVAKDTNDGQRSSDTSDAYQTANETEDAFETANEKETTTESEAFHTGAESLGGNSSEELTETESGPKRQGTVRHNHEASTSTIMPNKRASMVSTASTSDGEPENREVKTPVQSTLSKVKYRLRMGRGSRRSRVGSEEPEGTPRSSKDSPASFMSNKSGKGQSLAAELGNLGADSGDDMDGTPSGTPSRTTSQKSTPARTFLMGSLPPPVPKIPMVSSSMMTEPWEPSTQPHLITTTAVQSTPIKMRDQAIQGTPLSSGRDPAKVHDARETGVGQGSRVERSVNNTAVRENYQQESSLEYSELLSNITPSQELQASASATTTIPFGSVTRELSFSSIQSVETEPALEDKTKDRPSTAIFTEKPKENDEVAKDGNVKDAASAGVIGSVLGWAMGKRQSTTQPSESSAQVVEDRAVENAGDAEEREEPVTGPLREVPANLVRDNKNEIERNTIEKNDQSSQTMLSADEIENLLGKSNKSVIIGGPVVPSAPSPSGIKLRELARDTPPNKSTKRPGSSSSVRASNTDIPPLPADHRQAIEAASQRASTKERAQGSMGPPLAPASAYRTSVRRPITPGEQTASPQATATPATPTTPRNRYSTARSTRSRRSSVSSFESEIDARFNIRADGMPAPIEGGTDPRMIQAITQTMIGEYLWKYTRKAGRGDMSSNRHRRFFWVHPYTRTLYWSGQDPSTAGRAQLKAKSVAIEAIRVVGDDNPMPPGLHRKSIIVETPGREVKFTATTGQRHETWFNAVSYLLLRSGPDAQYAEHLTPEDVAEFNPGMGDYSGITAASRTSLSTYNSRTNTTRRSRASSRGESPSRGSVRRISQGVPQTSVSSRMSKPKHASVASRISGYWKQGRPSGPSTGDTQRDSTATSSIYDASVVNDSAEDVRQVLEKQDEEADRLENVRACCDGKHDVGSLNRRSGFAGRIGSQASRNSHHSHAH